MTKSSHSSDYLQPDFYRFNSDSIFLAERAVSFLEKMQKSSFSLIDSFCGCGVVGLEVLKKKKTNNIKDVTFVEKNKNFQTFLIENMKLDSSGVYKNALWKDFFYLEPNDFEGQLKECLVLINPPYFKQNTSREPLDPNRKMARFFDSNQSIIQIIKTISGWKNFTKINVLMLFRESEFSIPEISREVENCGFIIEFIEPLDLKTSLISYKSF